MGFESLISSHGSSGLFLLLPPQRSRPVESVICHRVDNRVDDFWFAACSRSLRVGGLLFAATAAAESPGRVGDPPSPRESC
jgi:hypothetical protein